MSVYALGYPASIFGKWAKKEMNLHERAGNMLEYIASGGIGTKPIALICHSLGGILVKEMLRISNECADEGWKAISGQTRLAVFMATPHKGASLASAVKLIVPRLASIHVDLLTNDSGYLTSLNQSYRELANGAGIATVAYYEKYKTKNAGFIVSEDSADPGVGTTRPVAVDADHISISRAAVTMLQGGRNQLDREVLAFDISRLGPILLTGRSQSDERGISLRLPLDSFMVIRPNPLATSAAFPYFPFSCKFFL